MGKGVEDLLRKLEYDYEPPPVVREIRHTTPDVCPQCNLDHAGSCDW